MKKTILTMVVMMVLASGIAFAGSYENWEQLYDGIWYEQWETSYESTNNSSLSGGSLQFKPVEKDIWGDFSEETFDIVLKTNPGLKNGFATRMVVINNEYPTMFMVYLVDGVAKEYWIADFNRR